MRGCASLPVLSSGRVILRARWNLESTAFVVPQASTSPPTTRKLFAHRNTCACTIRQIVDALHLLSTSIAGHTISQGPRICTPCMNTRLWLMRAPPDCRDPRPKAEGVEGGSRGRSVLVCKALNSVARLSHQRTLSQATLYPSRHLSSLLISSRCVAVPSWATPPWLMVSPSEVHIHTKRNSRKTRSALRPTS